LDNRITKETLYEFLLKNDNSYYAQIMRECGCISFVDKYPNEDYTGHNYIFKRGFVDSYSKEFNILFIENKSYLIYKTEENQILVWVCYTEEKYRRRKYMLKLLEKLSDINPDYNILVDTFNEGLMKLCNKIKRNNISLLER